MLERDKQRMDQADKQARHQQHEHEHKKHKEAEKHSADKQARSDVDPASAQDQAYIERMNEKTSKH